MNVDLRHGDCVELMRQMPDCSVDSIVTDPPYGLEFMGKDWDAPWKAKPSREFNEIEAGTLGGFSRLPNHSRVNNVRCEACQRWKFSSNPCDCAQPKFPNARLDALIVFQHWFTEVAGEALRVLKPGGHLLAFGGTRTYHRMACAIEDAGFEIRDSIHWVYGSGFPKSLDVSKAIDKSDAAREQQARRYRFTEWVRSTGLTSAQIDEATGTNMGGHYTTAASQPAIMTVEHLDAVRHLIGEVPEWVEAECRKRSVESKNFAAREVVGTSRGVSRPGFAGETYGPDGNLTVEVPVTLAATDEARRWEGWGTALKPAHEPIVVARKPLAGTVAQNVLEHGTGGLNIDGCRVGIAPGDEPKAGHRTATFGTQETVSGGDGSGGWQASSGRWPANVVFDRAAGEALDQQSGERPSAGEYTNSLSKPERPWSPFGGTPKTGKAKRSNAYANETGGASRFFTQADFGPDDWPFVYQAKPSRKERNAGLDGLPQGQPVGGADKWTEVDRRKGEGVTRTPSANVHPTVKPVALMRHLVRLVTAPGGTVLDPFAGSGTTLVAAVLEGMNAIGCEMTDEYLPIIRGRVAWAQGEAEARAAHPEQPTLL